MISRRGAAALLLVAAVSADVSVALARLRRFPPLLPVMSKVTPSEQRKTVTAFFCSEGESESHSPTGCFFCTGVSALLGAAVAMRNEEDEEPFGPTGDQVGRLFNARLYSLRCSQGNCPLQARAQAVDAAQDPARFHRRSRRPSFASVCKKKKNCIGVILAAPYALVGGMLYSDIADPSNGFAGPTVLARRARAPSFSSACPPTRRIAPSLAMLSSAERGPLFLEIHCYREHPIPAVALRENADTNLEKEPPLRRGGGCSLARTPRARAAGSSVAFLPYHHHHYTELYNVGHVDYYAPSSDDHPLLLEHDHHQHKQQRVTRPDGQHDDFDAATCQALAAQGGTGHVSTRRIRVSEDSECCRGFSRWKTLTRKNSCWDMPVRFTGPAVPKSVRLALISTSPPV